MKKKKKVIMIAGTVLVVLSIIAVTLSFTIGGSVSDGASSAGSQTVTVYRGDLSTEISAAGNLALSDTEDLAFQMESTVYEVLVEEGDTVTEGQELAKLDTSEWDKQLKTYEKAVVTAQRNLTSKESAVTKAERQVTTAERQVTEKESALAEAEREITSKELAVREAELAVTKAEENLSQIEEVKDAQDNVDDAEMTLEAIQQIISGAISGGGVVADATYWRERKEQAQQDLADAQEDLQDILEDNGISLSTDVALELAEKQLAIEKAKLALEDAQVAVENANFDVEDARLAVEDAQYAVEEAEAAVEEAEYDVEDAKTTLEEAQSDLEEANSLSPIITAPYDGFIPKINVEGGDEVYKGTIAMQIADPDKFEAEITVSEIDISQVELGGSAWVEVDALDVILPATVTYISPTATISSGVVNYSVIVEVQSTTVESSEITAVGDNATMMTPADAQDITEQTMTASSSDIQLREGLTVTVSLVVSEAQDVLLVPYTAITTAGGQSYVQVVADDGTIEERAITTGVTDYSYTEVASGLEEGEKVLVSNMTTSTSTASDQEQEQNSGMMMQGIMNGSGSPPEGGPPGGGQ